jgi:hypothetical protein
LVGSQIQISDADRAAMATLTTMTRLVFLGPNISADTALVETLSNLKELVFHDVISLQNLSLKQLTNLESISTRLRVEFTDLANNSWSHLTYLRCDMNIQNSTKCELLAHLPLKVLVMDSPQPYKSWWHMVGQISSLESLVAYGVIERNMDDWGGLTNLTRLLMFESMIEGDNLTKLTALQRIGSNRQVPDSAKNMPYVFEVTNSLQYLRDFTEKL